MTPEKRQKAMAIALAAFLGVLGLRYLIPALGSGGGGTSQTLTRRGARTADAELPELVPLRLDALENKPGEFQIGRDPFRFYVPPKPPPTRVQPPPRPRPPQQAPRPQPTRSQEPQPPAVDVTFLGSFGPDRGRIAVFSDGSDLYNARIGDVVKTHFVVDSIGFESVDLKFVNFPNAPAKRLAAGG